MRRLFGLATALLIAAFAPLAAAAADTEVEIRSKAYIVMDAATGQVLAEKNADARMYPASITKILTCALALKEGDPQATTTMSYYATHSIDSGSTHIALTEGEVVSVYDLLMATMIESANDAANGLAEYVAGSCAAFADLLNQTAAELGAANSHFVNPSGLHDNNHYTTARDMATLTRWALTVDGFRALFGATEHTIAPTNKQPKSRAFGTHHHMLVESAYFYEGTTGGKLGWTPEARHTLVTLAERNGMELICVVLDTVTQYEKYEDAAALLDQAFASYAPATISTARYAGQVIPVYAGGALVSEVVLAQQEIRINRPPTLAKADIVLELVAPERYEAQEEIAPAIRFLDPGGNELAMVPADYTLRPAGQDVQVMGLTAGAPPGGNFTLPVWALAAAAAALLLAFLFAVRARNLARRRQKQLQRLQRGHGRCGASARMTQR